MPTAEVTLQWKIDGEDVPDANAAEAFVNATPERREDITARIVAHVRAALGPRASAAFQDAQEAVMMQITASARALETIDEALRPLEFDLDDQHVVVAFEDVTGGGRRRKTTKKSRRKSRRSTKKSRSTRRRRL